MRLSDRLVAQLVESRPPKVVLKDDYSGQEVTIPIAQAPGVWVREHATRLPDGGYLVEVIELSEADWATLCFALGYFWCGVHHEPVS